MKDETPSGSDEKRIQEYLAGRLSAAEAELFEQRLFTDDDFAAEVQRALEIRAAMAPAAVKRAAGGPPRRALFALAAAAGAAFLVVGVMWLRPPAAPVFRGVEQRMGLEVEVDGDALHARWQPIAGAAGYELRVFATDGRLLRNLETEGAVSTLDLGTPADSASAPAFVEVSALDELGQVLQRSDRVGLSDR
ncbi:MAG TPA: hypothetical protein VIQ99_06870 [Gammaproteobacteria bacterium]